MATTPQLADKLAYVVNAYKWEQDQILRWKSTMAHVPPGPASDVVGQVFKSIWDSYFDYVSQSNQVILDFCTEALKPGGDIAAAVSRLNKDHEQFRVTKIEKAAQEHAPHSEYFAKLDEVLLLELNYRDYIEGYLK